LLDFSDSDEIPILKKRFSKNQSLYSAFWEFPPQDWFEEIESDDTSFCLVLAYLNGNPITNLQMLSQIEDELAKTNDIIIRVNLPETQEEGRHLTTPSGRRRAVPYSFVEPRLNDELHHHICLIVNTVIQGSQHNFCPSPSP